MSLLLALLLSVPNTDPVTLLRTPHGGIQPQAVVDANGTLHLIYFKGEPRAGDLFYVKRASGQEHFSEPMQVNNVPGSAIAIGTVRGGQIAVGKSGRVHVAWNGSGQNNGMLYARMNDAGTAFEEQRNLMRDSAIPDGGCTLAGDTTGNVLVAWHAVKTGEKGEDHRKMWIARSADDGKTFANETPAWQEPTGCCGCCSTRGFADKNGNMHFLYRSAKGGDKRDIYLLSSAKGETEFQGKRLHSWKINTCPMSTYAMAEGPQGTVAAWDTEGQIFTTIIKPDSTFTRLQQAPGLGRARKHPSVAVNAQGQTMLAWTEGTGWQRGGALVWQVFDKDGKPTETSGRLEEGIPVWGLPTVVAVQDTFILIH
jgi:hypothetical protein